MLNVRDFSVNPNSRSCFHHFKGKVYKLLHSIACLWIGFMSVEAAWLAWKWRVTTWAPFCPVSQSRCSVVSLLCVTGFRPGTVSCLRRDFLTKGGTLLFVLGKCLKAAQSRITSANNSWHDFHHYSCQASGRMWFVETALTARLLQNYRNTLSFWFMWKNNTLLICVSKTLMPEKTWELTSQETSV